MADEESNQSCKPSPLTNSSSASEAELSASQKYKQAVTKALIALFLLCGAAVAIAIVSLGFKSMFYVFTLL